MSSFANKKSAVIKEYFKFQQDLETKYGKDSVIFYEVGAFFEIFSIPENDEDIKEIGQIDKISNILNIQKTKPNKKNKLSLDNPNMCGFPISALEKFSTILLQNSFTVGIVNQFKVKGSKKMERKLTQVLSPSIMLESDSNIITNYLVCLYVETNSEETTLCSIDLSIGKSECYISNDNCITKINKIIHSLSPREIVIYSDQKKEQIIERYNLYKYKVHFYSTFDKKIYNLAFQNLFLQKYFPIKNMISTIENLSLEKYPSSIICYILMIQFVSDHDDKILDRLDKPKIVKYDQTLQLSSNTISQLHLFNTNDKSVFDIINKTSTILGKRLLKERLLNPLTNVKQINKRYNEVEKLIPCYKEVEVILKKIKDIERLHRKLSLKRLQPCEFVDLNSAYLSIIELINYFVCKDGIVLEGEEDEYLKEYPCSDLINKELIIEFKKYIEFYKKYLNLDILEKYNIDTVDDNSLFNKGIYEEIDKVVIALKTQWDKFNDLRDKFSDIIGEKSSVRIEYTNTQGYYLITSNKRKNELKDIDDLTFKSQSSTCKIFSPKITALSDKILKYKEKLSELNKEKFIEFMITIENKYSECLKAITTYIANIDFYKSGSRGCIENKYCRPIIKDEYKGESYFKGKEIRHPLIEKIHKDIKYVPNDFTINNDSKGVILYGLNYSGKSSLLRSLGISCILAQIGYFVPCSSFTYFPFTKIMTKIALIDNLYKKESGFISELKELKYMMDNCDSNSLLLSDEVFATTENISGVSLLGSTILTLFKKNANFCFTTHSHNLLELERIKNIKNLKVFHLDVTTENGELVFNRKLKEGCCSDKYGIECSKILIKDETFIKDALEFRKELTGDKDLIDIKRSKYNKDVFVLHCELCKSKESLQCHHITFQEEFRKENKIPFNKNDNHNLVVLCEKCHQDIHKNKIIVEGYIETENGRVLKYNKVN